MGHDNNAAFAAFVKGQRRVVRGIDRALFPGHVSLITPPEAARRRILPSMSGIFLMTILVSALPLHQARHQVGQRQQIRHPDPRATLAEDDLRIGCDDVGPLPRHRAHAVLVDL